MNGRNDNKSGLAPRDPDLPEEVHLADLTSDPGERVNLAKSNPELVDQLMEDLQSWATEIQPD